MLKKSAFSLGGFLIICSFLGLTSCYQAHSDDDLRTVPVTNNPNLVPQPSPTGKMSAFGY